MKQIWNRYLNVSAQLCRYVALTIVGMSVMSLHAQEQAKSQEVVIDIPGEAPVTQPQGSVYRAPKLQNAKLARVTVYRPAKGEAQGVAHVAVNGQYHTSLQSGGYSELCVLPSEFTLAANMVETEPTAEDGARSSLSIKPRAAQDVFLRVQPSDNNMAAISLVSLEDARAELQKTRRQVHVASRVANLPQCDEQQERVDHTHKAHEKNAK